jgi:hypothetical protein
MVRGKICIIVLDHKICMIVLDHKICMIVLDHYMRACKMHQFFCGAFYDSQIYYNCISSSFFFFFSFPSLFRVGPNCLKTK